MTTAIRGDIVGAGGRSSQCSSFVAEVEISLPIRRTPSIVIRRQLESQELIAYKLVPQGTKPGETKTNKQGSMPLLRQTLGVFFSGKRWLPESFPKATAFTLMASAQCTIGSDRETKHPGLQKVTQGNLRPFAGRKEQGHQWAKRRVPGGRLSCKGLLQEEQCCRVDSFCLFCTRRWCKILSYSWGTRIALLPWTGMWLCVLSTHRYK